MRSKIPLLRSVCLLLATLVGWRAVGPGPTSGLVLDEQKLSATQGGLSSGPGPGDRFGESIAALGDLDGDGIDDIVVGSLLDDDGGTDRGALSVIFLNATGTAAVQQKISSTQGGFGGALSNGDRFGESVTNLGDLDGDGVTDIAVGASRDDDGGVDRGAVWILLLNADGTVKAARKISDTAGGFTGELSNSDFFGFAVAALGDLDGDGVQDLAVGCRNDDDGGSNRGAVWILFLNANGTVGSHQKISSTQGSFAGPLTNNSFFGSGLASLGDLNGDGKGDLAVGAHGSSDTGPESGALWILFLDNDGTVLDQQKISGTQGGFTGTVQTGDEFGRSLSSRGDVDGDGLPDIGVGAPNDDDGGTGRGTQWILFLASDGTVKSHRKLSDTSGGFQGVLQNEDAFGRSSAWLGDVDGDGVGDLAVGAKSDQDGGFDSGAVWILFMENAPLGGPGPGKVFRRSL